MYSDNIKKINNIRIYFTVFVLLYFSNDTLLFGTNSNRVCFYIQIFALLILFIYLGSNLKKISRTALTLTCTLIFFNICTVITNADFSANIIKYCYNIFAIIVAAEVVSLINYKKFIQAYSEIMSFLGAFAIILFLIAIFASGLTAYAPQIINSSGLRYYYFVFGNIESLSRGVLPRMYGIFREPGVFVIFLELALIFTLFSNSFKLTKFQLATLVGGIIVTFSTAGYFVLILISLLYIVNPSNKINKRKKIVFVVLLFGLGVFVFCFSNSYIYHVLFGKLIVRNASLDSRLGSFQTNIEIFKMNPFFGKGWTFCESNFQKVGSLGVFSGGHNTNTFLKLLALYGIIWFIICITLLFFSMTNLTNSYLFGLALSIVIFVLFSNEDLTVNIILYILLYYGIKRVSVCEEEMYRYEDS